MKGCGILFPNTVDLLTGIVTEFEKHAWFLRASLE